MSLSTTTPTLAAMLGLAVGIDYSLLVFARARTELRAGADVREAVATATATAGTAVVVAGATVVIALVALIVVGIPFLTQMGLAAAATVAVTVLAALTAVPALLSLLGRRVLPRRERRTAPDATRAATPDAAGSALERSATATGHHEGAACSPAAGRGVLGCWGSAVTRQPVVALVVGTIAIASLAIPAASLTTALPSPENDGPATSSRQAYDLLVEGFGPGSQASLVLVVDAAPGAAPGTAVKVAVEVVSRVQRLGDVTAVQPPIPSRDGTATLVTVIPASGPTDTATTDLVREIRSATQHTADADVLVTGRTALDIDVNTSLVDALPLYVGIIVVLALLLLVMLFRSIAVPVLATVGFLLSLGASLGAMVAIYQWGWLASVFGVNQPSPIVSFIPVILVGILFGLAIDYQTFLVSAMHEAHSRGESPRRAVVMGFSRAAGVVVAAAAIMSGVFGGFAFSGDPIVGSIGTALIVGVLADALVVRMVLMPAALSLLGAAAWWMPHWMQRLVPDIDAEGRALAAPHETSERAKERAGDRAGMT